MDPAERPNADWLLEHPFIKKSQGKKLLAELVANSIDQIEAYRESRARSARSPSEEVEAECAGRQVVIVDEEEGSYRYSESGTTKVYEDGAPDRFTTNESGTMIVKKTPQGSAGKEPGAGDEGGSGSMVYHRVKGEGGEAESEYEVYIKIFREFNRKYEKDRVEMELKLNDICQYLTFNQRNTGMEVFLAKKKGLREEMEAEIQKVRARYGARISDIEKIIEYKDQLEVIRSMFKDLGVDIEELECMKDIGEKNKQFRKQNTFEILDTVEVREEKEKEKEKEKSGNGHTSSQQIIKKLYKIGEKSKMNLNIGSPEETSSKIKGILGKERDKANLSSRAMLSKNPGSPSNLTPKGGNPSEKKTNLSSKNLLSKKPLVSFLAEKSKQGESSSDKIVIKKKP